MAGKKFELEQVLNYRAEVEKARQLEFASAKQEVDHATHVLNRHESDVDTLTREFSNRQGELSNIEEMRRYVDYFARKKEDIKSQKERIDQLTCIMSQRRDELLDATRDKKVLESLKEKKEREFKQEMAQKEQAFLDEIAIQKKNGQT